MPEKAKSIAAYHRQLSSHLSTLLRSTGSTKPSPSSSSSRQPANSHTTSSVSMSKVSSAQSSHSQTTNETTSPHQLHHTSSHPPPLVGTSTRTQSTETAQLATPPISPQQAIDRQADQKRAWREAGSKIFIPLPPDFNLVLKKAPKSGMAISTGVTKKGVQGLGIDLHISQSQDLAIKMGLMSEGDSLGPIRTIPRHANVDRTRLSAQPSMESLSGRSFTSGPSPMAASSASIITGPPHPVPMAGVQRRRKSEETSQAKRELVGKMTLRDPREDEKLEDYEARRELRMKKKQAELQGKIVSWRDNVQLVYIEVPEIEPTPPTPSIASGMLRLSPFTSRPTCLPGATTTRQSAAPDDFAIRLRSLDALLGDMSLVHPRSNGILLPPAPLKVRQNIDVGVFPGVVDVREGMPTPKASDRTSIWYTPTMA